MMLKRISIILNLVLVCTIVQARTVTGTVACGKEKLSDVIVTDGVNFTRTIGGKFKFEISDNADFVYIITPDGYVAPWSSGVPAFYQSASGRKKFDFELQKTLPGDKYSIIAVSDPQTKEKHFKKFCGKPLEDLCKTAASLDGVAVGLVLGDICWDALDVLEKYKQAIVSTGIPFYPVVGNHDHDLNAKGDHATTDRYRKVLGPENYAFFLGNDLVVAVDNIIYDTQKIYQEGYAPHVLEWVKNLLTQVPADTRLYIAQHSPLQKWEKNNMRIVNGGQMLDIVKGHETIFISGHTHINNNMDYGNNITEQNVAAICGAWWDTKHNTDGTPRGYKVFTMQNDSLTWYYKSVGHKKDFQIEVFEYGQAPRHPESVVVNVWDWDPLWKVEWYQDGVYMGVLDPVIELSPIYTNEIETLFAARGREVSAFKRPRANYHYFAATPCKTARSVRIVVKSRFGQVWQHEVAL